eukprot:scaffold7306_cov31-Tisochrysis_lutea.AAC.2
MGIYLPAQDVIRVGRLRVVVKVLEALVVFVVEENNWVGGGQLQHEHARHRVAAHRVRHEDTERIRCRNAVKKSELIVDCISLHGRKACNTRLNVEQAWVMRMVAPDDFDT